MVGVRPHSTVKNRENKSDRGVGRGANQCELRGGAFAIQDDMRRRTGIF
uniref:Uncharacterized protein n=1 Tax=Anguilla anguilla TaxID=7936 RepID=A0A0E9W3B3_ANGAN